ncbi:MAG: hypothetical protein Kow0027_06750 [Saprospiraceae bacterium]
MRIIPLLLSIAFSVFFAAQTKGQNCGCEDQGNCPQTFPPNSNTTVCYDITDAFNNDLADPAQGVCGVYVKFRHGRIGNLNLTLTSPDGTQVTLVDASSNCNTWTPVALWDIQFVPCGDTCEPDTVGTCAYPCTFEGCPPNCAWQNATYTGSYHPFSGCLEDFNTGPVNGQWCLEVSNDAMFNGGEIFDFEIVLCDQSGIFCCEADAGNLAFEPDVLACQGDSILDLSPSPIYGAAVPDSSYGYTYTIFANDSLLAYDSLTDLTGYLPGDYQVCGLSFLWADSTNLPAAGTPLTPDTIYNNLNGPNPDFCGDIDTNCILVSISAPIPPVFLTDTICGGDTVYIGTSPYIASGNYSDTLSTPGGCDSIVNLSLTVLPADTLMLADTICSGQSVIVGTDTLGNTGIHEVLLQNRFGCDSLVVLDLLVVPPDSTILVDTICGGDTIYIGSMPFFETGIHSVTLTSSFDCDSVVVLDLTVIEILLDVEPSDELTCDIQEVSLDATVVATTGTPSYLWSTTGGNITGPLNTATTTADAPGMYTVSVQVAGCSLSSDITVGQNILPPTALPLIAGPDTLTCTVDSVQLDGSGSSGQGGLSFAWSSQNGSPVSDPNSPLPMVGDPDVYQLIVMDSLNGCADTASVEVFQNILQPTANAGPDDTLTCALTSLQLDGSSSAATGGTAYAWTALSGNLLPPLNIPNPTANQPGTYQLIVTDMVNGCQDTDLVVVAIDTVPPVPALAFPEGNTLTCTLDSLHADAGASAGNQLLFQWGGPIAAGQGSPIATIAEPGNYTLQLTEQLNGCTADTSFSIGIDTVPPVADAGPPGSVSCTVLSVTVGGNATSMGPGFSYLWSSSPGGAFVGPTDQPFATVEAAATYYLSVTNNANGCTAIDSTVIANNANPPVANAGPDLVIDCDHPTVTLDGSNSTIVPFTIVQWHNSSGDLIGTTPQVQVDYPDTFVLSVSFAFCEDSDTVIVTATAIPPIADAGPDMELDCDTGQAIMDGTASTNTGNLFVQWTSPDGQIQAGTNTYTPTVGAPGTYIISITDIDNNCTARDTALVTLDTAACTPFADAGADGLVNCYHVFDTLTANGTTGPFVDYDWTAISGTVADQSDPFAPLVSSGTFVFTVSNTATGLFATDTVFVAADTVHPVASAHPATFLSLTCPELAGCYALDASGSSQGPQYSYQWESIDGNFCTPTDQLNVEVMGVGIYSLRVTDTLNGCFDEDAVFLQLLDFAPLADAGSDLQMSCGDTTITLDGSGSSAGTNFQYQWFSNGGTVVSGGNTTSPVVAPNNLQDTFYLEVYNSINQCADTASVIVFAPTGCFPLCQASVSGPLTCADTTVTLSGAGSNLSAITSYNWNSTNGSFCAATDSIISCANAPGIYTLAVTNTFNGVPFTTTCQVQVLQDIALPSANAGPDRNLTCQDTVLNLDGSGSSSGPEFTYQWTANPGNILSGANSAIATINSTGNYTLTVTDTTNGCTASDLVTIGLDTLHPVADAGPGAELTCSNSNATLFGSAVPANVTYQWTTQDGDICAAPNSPNPVVCAAGTYLLTTTLISNGCTDTASVVVTADDDFPVVSAGPDLSYTCSDTVFTLAATATGGALLEYQWTATNGGCINGPDDILQITVGCPGTYTLVVTDVVNGCTASSVMEVIADTLPPLADAGADQFITCQQLVVQLDGGNSQPAGMLSFEWSTTDGHILSTTDQPLISADSVGTYLLTVTNLANQCTGTDSAVVSLAGDIPVVSAGPDTSLTCARTSLALDGSASSSGPGVFYSWVALPGNIVVGANTNAPVIDEPGTYILTLEDTISLCLLTDTVEVGLDTVAPSAQLTQTPDTVTCAQPSVTLDAGSSVPMDSLSFLWVALSGNIAGAVDESSAVVTEGGAYLLTVTNTRNGCTDQLTVNVAEDTEAPLVEFADAPVLNCYQPQVQPEVLPPTAEPIYGYAWNGPQPIQDPNSNTPTVSEPGLYFVTVTNNANGCEATGSILITENFAEPVAVASATGALDCDNEEVLLSGAGSSTGNVSYQWTTTSGGSIGTPNAINTLVNAPGWYSLTVQFLNNGCTATDSVEVLSLADPIVGANIELTPPDCIILEGSLNVTAVIGGADPFFYSIDGGIATNIPEFLYLDPGSHLLTIEDLNGCSLDTTIYLPYPEEVLVELGPDHFIDLGETVDLEAQLSIALSEVDTLWWLNLSDSVECPTCLSQTVAPLETTVYRIYVVDANGCMAEDKVTVWVNSRQPVYVPNAFSPNGDGTNDRLIFFAGPEVARVRYWHIFDRWGNLVFQAEGFPANDPAFGWNGLFNGQPMNAAVFVWKAEVEFLDGRTEVLLGDVTLLR